MYFYYGIVSILLSLSTFVEPNEFDYDGWLQVKLYHSFDDKPVPNYKERGNITISSIRSNSAMAVQPSLTQLDIDKLSELAEQDNKYRLKAVIKTSSGSETTFLTSILACNLLGSNLEDILYIWIDSAAEPVSVNLATRGTCSFERPKTKMLTTEIQVKYPDGGPIPDTATFIQKLEREKQAREAGEVKDNRSFFAKYWMYIVPAIIFFVLTSATNPEAGGGGGGQRQ